MPFNFRISALHDLELRNDSPENQKIVTYIIVF